MPYVDDITKHRFAKWLQVAPPLATAGELAFVITRLVILHVRHVGPSFVSFAQAIGVLDATRHEFKRRVLDPHEDRRRKQNGDVYAALFDHFESGDDHSA